MPENKSANLNAGLCGLKISQIFKCPKYSKLRRLKEKMQISQIMRVPMRNQKRRLRAYYS